jgi:hypothetical protein
LSEELFVDASIPFVFADDVPLAFFASTDRSTWLYAARAARIALDGDQYRVALVRNRKREPGPSGGLELVTKGGQLTAQLNVAALVASAEDETNWTEAIKRHSPFIPPDVDRVDLRPLGLRNGRMTIGGLEGLVADPASYRDMAVGMQTSVPISLPLTPDGADTLWGVLQARHTGFPITVRLDYDYDVLFPGAHYTIEADTEQTYKFFELSAKARASYFGLFGAQADVDVVREQLIGSGAVHITWIARPEGFDESRIAQLQNSILDAFAKSALDLMVKEVVPNAEAPEPDGFFGGVSVTLKDYQEVKDLNLSGEFKENDLRTQTFSNSFSFLQLGGLDPDRYGTDVTGDNMLPITLNLGKDPSHVQKYACQYGYVRPDGTVQSDRADATGADGLLLRGVVQWGQHDPRPAQTELQFLVDWEDLEWEDYATQVTRENGDSGVLFQFTPGNFIKQIAILCDFPRSDPGTFGAIEWRTVLPPNPDGTQPKNYSGGVIYEGAGKTAAPDRLTLQFPYNHETVQNATFEWEATLIKPDGTLMSLTATESLERSSAVLAVASRLQPAPHDVRLSPAMTALRPLAPRPRAAADDAVGTVRAV